jgi:hypothetical protein
VNNSPVRDTFREENGRLAPVETIFYSFGAGMEIGDGNESGLRVTQQGAAMVRSGFTTPLPEINLIVGTVSDHTLYINGKTISLRTLCGRNRHIKLRID